MGLELRVVSFAHLEIIRKTCDEAAYSAILSCVSCLVLISSQWLSNCAHCQHRAGGIKQGVAFASSTHARKPACFGEPPHSAWLSGSVERNWSKMIVVAM